MSKEEKITPEQAIWYWIMQIQKDAFEAGRLGYETSDIPEYDDFQDYLESRKVELNSIVELKEREVQNV